MQRSSNGNSQTVTDIPEREMKFGDARSFTAEMGYTFMDIIYYKSNVNEYNY